MKPTLASEPVFRVIACMLVAAGTAAAQTPNYVAKFNSLSQPVNSQMFDNGYAVGIGTLSPVNADRGR